MATKNKINPFRKPIKKEKNLKEGDYINFIRILVDNLILLFLKPSTYYQSFKEYLYLQLKYRTKYMLMGILLFLISLYFIFFFIGFFLMGIYLLLYHNTTNQVLSIFLVAWISFLIFFIISYMSFQSFYKLGRKLPEKRGNQ